LNHNIALLIAYIESAKARVPDLLVTFVDLSAGRSATITRVGPCSTDGEWENAIQLEAERRGYSASEKFSPSVVVFPTGGENLTAALKSINGDQANLEGCSVAIRLSPSTSANADRALHEAVGDARDSYGLPILFWIQQDLTLLVTMYQQCSERRGLVVALQQIINMKIGNSVQFLSVSNVTAASLRRAYGPIT
jgi:hypothetical protein